MGQVIRAAVEVFEFDDDLGDGGMVVRHAWFGWCAPSAILLDMDSV